jgi:hypothetical protein
MIFWLDDILAGTTRLRSCAPSAISGLRIEDHVAKLFLHQRRAWTVHSWHSMMGRNDNNAGDAMTRHTTVSPFPRALRNLRA